MVPQFIYRQWWFRLLTSIGLINNHYKTRMNRREVIMNHFLSSLECQIITLLLKDMTKKRIWIKYNYIATFIFPYQEGYLPIDNLFIMVFEM